MKLNVIDEDKMESMIGYLSWISVCTDQTVTVIVSKHSLDVKFATLDQVTMDKDKLMV